MQSLQHTHFSQVFPNHFNRLFPELRPLIVDDNKLIKLAHQMMEFSSCKDSKCFSNGLSIFGQFLAHDITFETSSRFHGRNETGRFVNERTIHFDLDSMYGQWTQDYLYDENDRVKLLLGKQHQNEEGHHWTDLQRNDQSKAIIPDARNDENIIVSRMQVLFIDFHNCMIDYLRESCPSGELYREARRQVLWYYHWLIIHEYLRKICDPATLDNILTNGPKFYDDPCRLPLEFTGAAFRTGHSQTREDNRINKNTKKNLFELGSFQEMTNFVDWRYLFDFGDGNVQYAKLIDTKIAKAFHDIPFIPSKDKHERSLPYRNLRRGVAYGLPSGEDLAHRMCLDIIDVPERYKLGLPGTPLWYYILKEAEELGDGGEYMGPLGSTLLAEVFLAILQNDNESFLRLHPKWQPDLGREKGVFDFTDLIKWVYPEYVEQEEECDPKEETMIAE